MRYYENLFIVNPNIEQERLTQVIESVKNEISALDGKTLNVEDWGKRRLAYPIKKHKYGTYVLVQFESSNGGIVKALNEWLKLNQSILSHITVLLDTKPGETKVVPPPAENEIEE